MFDIRQSVPKLITDYDYFNGGIPRSAVFLPKSTRVRYLHAIALGGTFRILTNVLLPGMPGFVLFRRKRGCIVGGGLAGER